jgi:hypothetical protein
MTARGVGSPAAARDAAALHGAGPSPPGYPRFARLRDDGAWQTINHHLVMRDRARSGREASPTAAVGDSQGVKTPDAAVCAAAMQAIGS